MAKTHGGNSHVSITELRGFAAELSAAAHNERSRFDERITKLETDRNARSTPQQPQESAHVQEIYRLRADKRELEQQVERQGARNRILINSSEAEKEMHKLRSANGSLLHDKEVLQKEVNRLRSGTGFRRADPSTAEKELHKQRSLNGMLHGDVSRLQNQISQLQAERARSADSIAQLENELWYLKKENLALHQSTQAGQAIHELRSWNGSIQAENARLQTEVCRLKAEVSLLQKRAASVGPSARGTAPPRVPSFGFESTRQVSEAIPGTPRRGDFYPPQKPADHYEPNYLARTDGTSDVTMGDPRLPLQLNVPISTASTPTQQDGRLGGLASPTSSAAPSRGRRQVSVTSDPRVQDRPRVADRKRSPESPQRDAVKKAKTDVASGHNTEQSCVCVNCRTWGRPCNGSTPCNNCISCGRLCRYGDCPHGSGCKLEGCAYTHPTGHESGTPDKNHNYTIEAGAQEDVSDAVDQLILGIKAEKHQLTDEEAQRLRSPSLLE